VRRANVHAVAVPRSREDDALPVGRR
jgi:hypothetical protein